MITQNELKELLEYNVDTGIFTWKINKSPMRSGNIAGSVAKDRYTNIQINKKIYKAHRLAWLYVYGSFPNKCIDHINGNRSDNKISNLREANHSQNGMNKKMQSNNTSGVRGVYWNRNVKKWHAEVRLKGKRIYLGLFDSLELAELVVSETRLKYHGQFAYEA